MTTNDNPGTDLSQAQDAAVQRLLTLAEASRICGIAAVSLRQAVRLGRLKATVVGEGRRATFYVTQTDLETYLASRKTWRRYTGTREDEESR